MGVAVMQRGMMRLSFIVAVVALSCVYASSEEDLSGGTGPLPSKAVSSFAGAVSSHMKRAKKLHAKFMSKGGVEGIPHGGTLMKKWHKEANARHGLTKSKAPMPKKGGKPS